MIQTLTTTPTLRRPRRLSTLAKRVLLEGLGWGGWLYTPAISSGQAKPPKGLTRREYMQGAADLIARGYLDNPSGDGNLYRITPEGERWLRQNRF